VLGARPTGEGTEVAARSASIIVWLLSVDLSERRCGSLRGDVSMGTRATQCPDEHCRLARRIRRRASGFLGVVAVTIAVIAGTTLPASAADEVSLTLDPARPRASEPTMLTFTGSSDQPARLFATYFDYVPWRASGGGFCSTEPSNRASIEPGPEIATGQPVNGLFSLQVTYSFAPLVHGDGYWICMWLAEPDSIIPGRNPLAPPTETFVPFDIPVVKPPLGTTVRAAFPATAKRSRLIVVSRIASRQGPAKGSCILEGYVAGSWLYVSRYVPVDARGRCRIAVAVRRTGKQVFRVSFLRSAGFKASTSRYSRITVIR
jgi:hypothetical protein